MKKSLYILFMTSVTTYAQCPFDIRSDIEDSIPFEGPVLVRYDEPDNLYDPLQKEAVQTQSYKKCGCASHADLLSLLEGQDRLEKDNADDKHTVILFR